MHVDANEATDIIETLDRHARVSDNVRSLLYSDTRSCPRRFHTALKSSGLPKLAARLKNRVMDDGPQSFRCCGDDVITWF